MTSDTVLLVDNDPLFMRVVSQTLQAGGYDVDTASSLLAAEGLFEERSHAAIILSLDVRDRDPEEFLRELARDDRQPVFILVATHVDIREMVGLYETGFVFSHRRKPLDDLGDLIRDLGRAIEYRLVKRQNSYLLTQLRDTRDEMRDIQEFLTQVEKAASLGWVADGVLSDLESALAPAEGARPAVTDLQLVVARCRALVADGRSVMRAPRKEFRPIDVATLVASVTRLHDTTLSQRGSYLAFGEVDDTVQVSGDAPNLRIVVTALLQNAAQAMPGGGQIAISLVKHGANAHLSIQDHGPGMSSEALSRAFEPFFTTRSIGDGTGLGLTVAREIVHEHGGEIILASAEGEGTTVVVTLPLYVEHESLTDMDLLTAAA